MRRMRHLLAGCGLVAAMAAGPDTGAVAAQSAGLVRDGWQVTTMTDGAAAESAIRAAQPDVVILDVMLPGRSGYDVVLIDTAGRSPRDAYCIEELAAFLRSDLEIEKHLVLSATR